eukprot:jgi/Ulvmu1/11012/UM007_0192.1
MFDAGDPLFMQRQKCLDAVLRGAVYAADLPDAHGKLLQLLEPHNCNELNREAIKKGRFTLSQNNMDGFLGETKESESEKEKESKFKDTMVKAVEKSRLKDSSFTLATSATLSAEAKLSAGKVPLEVAGEFTGTSTTCAIIKLTDVQWHSASCLPMLHMSPSSELYM